MIYAIIIIIGIILDRFTKIYAINNFVNNPKNGPIINLTYLENRGAAFGILQDKRLFFIILTITIIAFLMVFFIKNINKNPLFLNIAISLIISGALGNFYDRLFHGYVVDFIEFSFVSFPIFNIADILVTTGCALILIYIIFLEKKY